MSPLRISSTKFSSSALILLITILSSSSHYQHVHAADTNTSSQEQNGVGNHDDTNASTDTAQSNTTTTTIDLPKQQLPTVNNALQVSSHGNTIPYTLTTIYHSKLLQQTLILTALLLLGLILNTSVIANISNDSLKLRMIHFILIRHVCITDCLGAAIVLPVPLITIAMVTTHIPFH
jgi:hypothetical protein